jgi:ferredoxin
MTVRKIVRIDEDKCNGCGECIPNCAEGALRIVDGKARLVSDVYCDGLGACLGVCPRDAIAVIERDADDFDLAAAEEHQTAASRTECPAAVCPGAALVHAGIEADAPAPEPGGSSPSRLRQWPVQLQLVPVTAPFFDGADLLLAADCVPFALADFHDRLLSGKRLLVGCPKLDDAAHYADKLAAILEQNDVKSLTVVHMEVPCCFGLVALAREAVGRSGKRIPVSDVTVTVQGEIRRPAETDRPHQPISQR